MNTHNVRSHSRKSFFSDRMIEKFNREEILEKYYCRPLEVMLRTHKNDPYCLQSRITNLPQGLMIASKESIH